MIAGKAIIDKNKYTIIPNNFGFNTASDLPNAVLVAAMSLKVRGKIEAEQNVLLNGTTRVTGYMAVQIAKNYGAETIIIIGQNQENLEKTKSFDANQIVSLKQNDEAIIEQLTEIHPNTPIGLVIDYLWGNPIELPLNASKGGGLDN